MEKKTTVHPVFLTLEQLELVRQLVKPSIEYDDDGDMNIWAEDENAMNAAQIYRQTEIANKIELQLAWLTVYEVHREHGGEEEGGWGYNHWYMRETEPFDNIEDLVHAFNKKVGELAEEVCMPLEEALDRLLTDEEMDKLRHNIDTSFTYLKMERFRDDAYSSVYLVIEVTPGSETTLHKPIWR